MSSVTAEDYCQFLLSSEVEKQQHRHFVLYSAFDKMNITPENFGTHENFIISSEPKSGRPYSDDDFLKFKTLSDEEKRRHPNYVLYLAFMRAGR
jgi:hypothetical protein